MPLYACEGIVLRSQRVQEADRLVHFFTDRFGRVRVKVPGVSRTSSRHGSIAEPFSHDHLSLYRSREDQPVFTLTRASLIHPHQQLRNELPRYYAASFGLELVDRCTEDGDPQYALWLLLSELLAQLETSPALRNLLLAFQLKAFRFFGVGLDLTRCVNCGASPPAEPVALSAELGGVLDDPCCSRDPAARPLSPALYRTLIHCEGSSLGELAGQDEVSLPLWLEAVNALRPVWQYHLDFDPKSLRFLQNEV